MARTGIVPDVRRVLRPYWVSTEAGAILLLEAIEDDENPAFAALPAHLAGETSDLLAQELSLMCREIFRSGRLRPGVYELEGHQRSYGCDGVLTFGSDGGVTAALAATPRFRFRVRQEHLSVIRRLDTRECDGFVELTNPSRSYGDSPYYYVDIAAALEELMPRYLNGNIAFTTTTIERYTNLQREMLFAIQAFWRYAQYP